MACQVVDVTRELGWPSQDSSALDDFTLTALYDDAFFPANKPQGLALPTTEVANLVAFDLNEFADVGGEGNYAVLPSDGAVDLPYFRAIPGAAGDFAPSAFSLPPAKPLPNPIAPAVSGWRSGSAALAAGTRTRSRALLLPPASLESAPSSSAFAAAATSHPSISPPPTAVPHSPVGMVPVASGPRYASPAPSTVSYVPSTSPARRRSSVPVAPAEQSSHFGDSGLPAGWEEHLLSMNVKQLNAFIKAHALDNDAVADLKKSRRRLKNRTYAKRSRDRKRPGPLDDTLDWDSDADAESPDTPPL